jgi:two-component system sensor histidine kinase BaeS
VRLVVSPCEVAVEDTGPGLEQEELPHAFDRFYLWSRYGRERRVGTGLGLAIVKELTRAMGGTVAVRSEPRRGTVFTVRLPGTARASADETAVEDAAAISGSERAGTR